jgi:integrase
MAGHLQKTPPSRNYPKGGWEARYRVTEGGRRKWRARTFATKRAAERFLAETVTDIHRGEYIDPTKLATTFGEVAAAWIDASSQKLKPKTLAGYEWCLNKHLLPEWGSVKVGDVDLAAVQGWIGRMGRAHSPQTVVGSYRILRLVFAYAVKLGKIRANPCDRSVMLPEVETRERNYLSHEQVELLATTIAYRPATSKHGLPIDRPELGLLIRFASYTGLRAGEIAALRIRHLDLAGGWVSVEEAVSDVGGRLITGKPKTKKGIRTVPIDADLSAAVKTHLGDRRLQPDAYLFVGQYGAQWNHGNFRGRFWKEAVTRAHATDGTFPLALTFHDLRHTYASLLNAAGVSLVEAARLMGHSATSMTETYTHLFKADLSETATRLGAARTAALQLA